MVTFAFVCEPHSKMSLDFDIPLASLWKFVDHRIDVFRLDARQKSRLHLIQKFKDTALYSSLSTSAVDQCRKEGLVEHPVQVGPLLFALVTELFQTLDIIEFKL